MAKSILVIGATSAIAEHCIRLWGLQPDIAKLLLIGRDANRLQAILENVSVRNPNLKSEAHVLLDFCDEKSINQLINKLSSTPIDIALIAHGTLGYQSQSQSDFQILKQLIDINATSAAVFAEAIVSVMLKQGHGTIGVISSIAGDRARKRNYHYGAAKSFVSFIAQGLQHRLVGSNVQVCLIKPGPTRTPMTIDLKGRKLAPVTEVANDIVKGMAKGQRTIYSPEKWRYIMFIIVHVPWFIFKRLNI